MKPKVLVIDDDADIRSTLDLLLGYEGFEVRQSENGAEGLKSLAAKPVDLVLLDIKMPGKDGLEILPEIRRLYPDTAVMMISGHGDIQTAVEAIRKGAFDFLEKPLDGSRILVSIRNCLRQRELLRENTTLREAIDQEFRILGESTVLRKLLESVEKVAASDARVLITGENGTGKELVARQVHLLSPRRSGPFIAVNCAAIPEDLIESELFGHEKGAFTGALSRRIGQFERASGGTLFLDEIGEMNLSAQAKVLRAIEQNEILRIGGTEPISVDPRIVAATNKDLQVEVEAKSFRMDLYYRLSVVPVHIPPLRERKEDVPILARNFLAAACRKNRISPKTLDAEAMSFLSGKEWPGNVRQLKNLMERAAVLVEAGSISAEDLQEISDQAPPKGAEQLFGNETFESFKDAAEAAFLRRKLEENNWNIKRTAERLKMQRSNLYKKLEKYNLK